MRPVLILLLALAVGPALAQPGLPAPRCNFSEGVAALRDGAREASRPLAGLVEGRGRAEAMGMRLRGAVEIFLGCGCADLSIATAEAAGLAAGVAGAPDVPTLRRGLEQAGLRITLARRVMESQGCR